jgi:hypothetical protein
MTSSCGDLLIASAGSAGVRERVHAMRHPDFARLWPSFNLIELSDSRIHIEAVSFSPKRSSRRPLRRALAVVRRVSHKWEPEPMTFHVTDPTPRVELDEADFTLVHSQASPERWNFSCERRVRLREGQRLPQYVDFVHALPALLPRSRSFRRAQRRIELAVGGVTRYAIEDGLCRTLDEGRRSYGSGTAFEWVGLFCRYGAARATLRLGRANAAHLRPFGSLTDLATGRERPVGVVRSDVHWAVTWESCAPRSLLRIYWPLERS